MSLGFNVQGSKAKRIRRRWQKTGIGESLLLKSVEQIRYDAVHAPSFVDSKRPRPIQDRQASLKQSALTSGPPDFGERTEYDNISQTRKRNRALLLDSINKPLITQPDPLQRNQTNYIVDYIDEQLQMMAKYQQEVQAQSQQMLNKAIDQEFYIDQDN